MAAFAGKYEALRELGSGGMGKVYLGRSKATGQEVVLKVLHDHLAGDQRAQKLFAREMQVLARFNHPHAVALLDSGWDDGQPPFLVLEYIPGATLTQILAQHGRLGADVVARLLRPLCSVLYAAHGVGLMHRDLSADNVMVVGFDTPQEKVKVMDFGLARQSGGGVFVPLEKLTSANNVGPGTPDFVSPEQARGEPVDHRADLYSLGVLLYALLAGRLPFEEAETTPDILRAHIEKTPPTFGTLGVRDIPPAFESVVRRCLAKRPDERPASAMQLAGLVSEALGRPIASPADFPTPEPLEESKEAIDPSAVLARFEAWMPEQIAVMKLRGFVDAIGGQVLDSQPGMIQVQFLDPRSLPAEPPRGLLSFFSKARAQLTPIYLYLDLHLDKKESNRGSLVEISVVLREEAGAPALQEMRQGYGQRICRELKAFLMS